MSATALGAIIAVVAGYASSIYLIISRIEGRLDRIEARLTGIEIKVAEIGQQLVDHIGDHPGPTERIVR